MRRQVTGIWLAAVLFCLPGLALADSSAYQVTFATVSCSGESGFATLGVDQIYKIQSAGCMGEDGKQLKQLLAHDGAGSYTVYTLTEEESANVTNEIKAYMAARRGLLERSDAIIVKP